MQKLDNIPKEIPGSMLDDDHQSDCQRQMTRGCALKVGTEIFSAEKGYVESRKESRVDIPAQEIK